MVQGKSHSKPEWLSTLLEIPSKIRNSYAIAFLHLQATFNAPSGHVPLALDLKTMGKGQVWINGQSIGRHWPAYTAHGSCGACDYAGIFTDKKCRTNCGEPSQRWWETLVLALVISYVFPFEQMTTMSPYFQVPCSSLVAEPDWESTCCVWGVGRRPERDFVGPTS